MVEPKNCAESLTLKSLFLLNRLGTYKQYVIMKKQFLLIAISLFSLLLNAQSNIPIQGKLLDNSGTPITGARNFTATLFPANSNTVLWSETYNNIPVVNGLYNLVLTSAGNTFSNAFSNNGNVLDIEIKVNGQALQRFKIHAPVESDPSVPAHLKDGVSWSEITNKPALDNSPSNELQQLTYQNGTLSISNGNSIAIPLLSDDVNIPNTLTVGSSSTATSTLLEQNTNSTQTFISSSVWQSFSLNEGGELSEIKLQFGNANNVNIKLRIFQGNGTNSSPIFDATFNASLFNSATGMQTFDINAHSNQPVILASSMNYTMEFTGIGAGFVAAINTNDPYPFGISSLDNNTDLQFAIIAVQTSSYLLEVTEDFVELGTPEVRTTGRYYDKSGLVSPVGAITAYAGDTPPVGWLFCQGQEISRTAFSDLFGVIGTAWGQGNGSTSFRIPDLRGRFLRGVDNNMGVDNDAPLRTALYAGGNSGDNVGSYQNDATKKPNTPFSGNTDNDGEHIHDFPVNSTNSPWTEEIHVQLRNDTYDGSVINFQTAEGGAHTHTLSITDGGDNETRPKNANVNYIIKY